MLQTKLLSSISRRYLVTQAGATQPEECPYKCPELNACINSSVWCDGISHCPTGYDEALTHCSFLFKLPPLYLFIGSLFLVGSAVITGLFVYRRCRRRPQSILQTRLKSLSSDTAIIDEKGIICWHSDSSARYVEVDRVTTVWPTRILQNWQLRRTIDGPIYYFVRGFF